MNNILLSIIIPYKNTDYQKFKSLSLSISSSTPEKVELLFINDKSNHDKAKELSELIDEVFKDSGFNIVKLNVPEGNPGGILQGRLFGFTKANGEFVWGIDSDDLLYPYSIDTILKYISETNCELITWRLSDKTIRESKYTTISDLDWNNSVLTVYNAQYRFFITREILGYTHCKVLKKSLAIKSADELQSLGYINLAEDQIFTSYWFKDLSTGILLIPEILYNYLDPDCSGKLYNIEPRFQLANFYNVLTTRNAFKTFYGNHSKDLLIELTDYDIYRPQILYSISRVPSKDLCPELMQELIEEFGIERIKEYSKNNNNLFSALIPE